MSKTILRYGESVPTILERSRFAVMEFLARRFKLLFKAFTNEELKQVETGIENALYEAFQDSKRFQEAEKENRKPHEFSSRSSGTESQLLRVHGPGAKFNRPPLLSKRGWK